jgi:mono/diheme cytochrome c family protein
MSLTRRRLLWAAALVVASAVVLLVALHGHGVSAARPPTALEERAAVAAWRFLVPADVKREANPVAASDALLTEAADHWADHCAVCHASDGGGSAKLSRHMYPRVPDLRSPRTQSLTDGELFYAIEQGIPWTGMPAWTAGTDESERESWALVRFIRHLPDLTPAEIARIEGLMPKSAADRKQEQEIDDFLKPASPPAPVRGGGSGS